MPSSADIERIDQLLAGFQQRAKALETPQRACRSGYEAEFCDLGEEDEYSFRSLQCSDGFQNMSRNRYADIIPFDATRVKIPGSNDYINASYIRDVFPEAPTFIAAQGPIPSTNADFWLMVFATKAPIIIMTTNIVENNQVKCEKYWPDMDTPLLMEYYGISPAAFAAGAAANNNNSNNSSFRSAGASGQETSTLAVAMVDESVGMIWCRRHFKLTYTATDGSTATHEVTQYQFTDWPDGGVPKDCDHFLLFVRAIIDVEQRLKTTVGDRPIVVHCSAGIGRTGTFIAVYVVLHALQFCSSQISAISVIDIVRKMRVGRRFMVQTRDQYQFIYRSILSARDFVVSTNINYHSNPVFIEHSEVVPETKLRRVPSHNLRSAAASAYKASTQGNQSKNGAEEYTELIDLIMEPNLMIIQSLSELIHRDDMDGLADIVFKIAGTKGVLLPLVLRMISWEVNNCESQKVLFRRNSFTTKILGAAFNLYGSKYLVDIFRPIVLTMLETPNMSYETNPTLLSPGENLGENRHTLRRLAESFFNAIINNLPTFPLALNLFCHGLALATSEKYPDSVLQAVGAALFLRFYVPAIVSPETHGILDKKHEIPSSVKRGLLMVSKIIQAVANMTTFSGFREEHMQPMNSFVSTALPKLEDFLRKVSTHPKALDRDTLSKCEFYEFPLAIKSADSHDMSITGPRGNGVVCDGVEALDLIHFHQILCQHSSNLQRVLSNLGSHGLADRLLGILAKIGPAGELNVYPPPVWNMNGGSADVSPNPFARRFTRSSKDRYSILLRDVVISEVTADTSTSDLANSSALSLPPSSPVKEVETKTYPGANIKHAPIKNISWEQPDRGTKCEVAAEKK